MGELALIVAILAFGLWGFLPKLATGYLDTKSVFIWSMVGQVALALIVWIWLAFHGGSVLAVEKTDSVIALIGGVLGYAGVGTYIIACNKGLLSTIVVVTSLYPLIAGLLSFTILKESINAGQSVGILLAFLSLIILVEPAKRKDA